MAQPMKHISIFVGIMLVLAMAEATPPGIAKDSGTTTCNNPEYKECMNLVHVCPKFCPNGCTTDCRSCKPICIGDTTTPSGSDKDKSDDYSKDDGKKDKDDKDKDDKDDSNEGDDKDDGKDKSPPPGSDKDKSDDQSKDDGKKDKDDKDKGDKDDSNEGDDKDDGKDKSPPPGSDKDKSDDHSKDDGKKDKDDKDKGDKDDSNEGDDKDDGKDKSPPTTPTPTPPSPSYTPTTPSPPSYTPTPPSPAPTPPTPSYPPSTSGKQRVRCKNKNYGQCYNVEHVCPDACPTGCQVDCASCKAVCNCDMPGAVCQDPRFIGGDGITFYFHGKKDQDFCLVSDSNIHINGHFIGKRNTNLTRDFTWVQSIGILFDNHKLFIGAQKTATWNNAIDRLALVFKGEPIFLPNKQGATWQSEIAPSISITRASETNNVVVEVEGNFKITAKVVPITKEDSRVHNYGITEDDCFAHLDLGFKFYSLSDKVNGVLGQTYGVEYVSQVKVGAIMPVVGGEKKFSSSTLFSTDCKVARFNGGASPSSFEMASLRCVSGIDGAGVVCKR